MEEERQVEERLLSEAQEILKKMLAEQERGSSHPVLPQDVISQVTDLQQMVNMLQAERDTLVAELQFRGRMRRVEKLHPPQSSEEAAENFRERSAKRQACRPEEIPNSERELAEWMCAKHLELRDALEIGPNELVVGGITADCQRCFGNASVLNASIHSEQHGHVKVRLLRQCRPVLSRYGMRGVRVGEVSNPGPVITRSASRILVTQVDSSGIEDERNFDQHV